MVGWIPSGGEVMHLDCVAVMLLHRHRFGRNAVVVDLKHIVHGLFDISILVHLGGQPESYPRNPIGGLQLHVREMGGYGGMFALWLDEFWKLELRFDPQRQQSKGAISKVGRGDVEIASPYPPQGWI